MSARKWTDAEVIEFRNKRRAGMSVKEIAREVNGSYGLVCRAILGYSYSDVPDPVPARKPKAHRPNLKRNAPGCRYRMELTNEEWETYQILKRKHNYTRFELLNLVGRPDLAEKYPAPGNYRESRK